MTGYCGNCQFFESPEGRPSPKTHVNTPGECRRGPPGGKMSYAPYAGYDMRGGYVPVIGWTETYVDGWCGEFREVAGATEDWKVWRTAALQEQEARFQELHRQAEAKETAEKERAKWWWQR